MVMRAALMGSCFMRCCFMRSGFFMCFFVGRRMRSILRGGILSTIFFGGNGIIEGRLVQGNVIKLWHIFKFFFHNNTPIAACETNP